MKGKKLQKSFANQNEVAALFDSIKRFKYLMMIDENRMSAYAIAGIFEEIVHLCKQK